MIYKRGDIWHYDFQADGNRYRGTTGCTTRKEAQKYEDEIRGNAGGKVSAELIWKQTRQRIVQASDVEFSSDWACEILTRNSRASEQRQKIYTGHIRRFFSWAEENHVTGYEMIDTDMANSFINSLHGSPATLNDYLNTMRSLFRIISEKFSIELPCFEKVKKVKQVQVQREAFTLEEIRTLAAAATGDMAAIVVTSLCTGLRLGDICNLQWDYIRDGWLIIPHARKTGKRLEIPLLPALCKLIYAQEGNHTGFIFRSLQARYSRSEAGICREFKELTESLGIAGSDSMEGYKKSVNTKGIHSLRHTFLYLATMNNWPITLVQSIAQHSSLSTTQIYTSHIDHATKSKYFAMLPDYTSEPEEKSDIDRIIDMVKNNADKNEILSALERLKELD